MYQTYYVMIDRQNLSMDDAGVSPVVGVILMVAVTVILAAVIGAFVLDLGGDVGQNAQAGVTFDEGSEEVTVQLNSVQTADSIWVVSDSDSERAYLSDDGNEGPPSVGASVTASTTADTDDLDYDAGDTISVIGEVDNEESVIQTYQTAE